MHLLYDQVVFCFFFSLIWFYLFIFGCLGLHCCAGFFPGASRGYSLVVVRRLLLLRSTGPRARGLQVFVVPGVQSTGSIVVSLLSLVALQHVESCRPGIEPVLPALAGRFFSTEPPGKPVIKLFEFKIFT